MLRRNISPPSGKRINDRPTALSGPAKQVTSQTSSLLTGKFRPEAHFSPTDHRHFNRNGEAFDQGETFSGLDYNTGLEAVAEIKKLFPGQENLAPVALRWILLHEDVSCIIPGASQPSQLTSNPQALEVPDLTPEQREGVKVIYEAKIKPLVHDRW
ncbi:aldo/keto reductase [Adhaeribacter arboris]|uniref:aldo/keto reductase n=1 Tax=Adhaeribacter arboris TaxID=2072846 RepID=UPI001E3199D6|nr:aldo/keto reductase [Adhaeribacter arboris]